MFASEIFIIKSFTINRFTSCTIVVCKVTTLGHETGYYSMEFWAFEMKRLLWHFAHTFFTSAQRPKIFRRDGSVEE
jgi:hypothetical protein